MLFRRTAPKFSEHIFREYRRAAAVRRSSLLFLLPREKRIKLGCTPKLSCLFPLERNSQINRNDDWRAEFCTNNKNERRRAALDVERLVRAHG